MEIREIIEKFNLKKAEQNGQPAIQIRASRKPTDKQIQMIKNNKPAILAELEIIEQERKAKIVEIKEAQLQREQEYLTTTDLRRCLVIFQDEFYNTSYCVETLHFIEEQNRFFRMQHGNYNHIPLKHKTETIKNIMEQSCTDYGMAGAAWEITQEQEAQIIAEQSPAQAKTGEIAKAEAEAKTHVKATKEAEKQAEKEARFSEAKSTGKPVVLRKEIANCDGSVIECSTDVLVWYAMPNGSTKMERIHTH